MAEFDAKPGSLTPSARGSPAPNLSPDSEDGLQKPDLHTGTKSSSLPAGVLNRHQKYSTSALTDKIDVERAALNLREMHK